MDIAENTPTTDGTVALNRAIIDTVMADRAKALQRVKDYINENGGNASDLTGFAPGYNAVPSLYGYALEIGSVTYDTLRYDQKKTLIFSHQVGNHNPAGPTEFTVEIDKTTTDTYQFTFDESYLSGVTLSGTLALPNVTGGRQSFTASTTLDANRQWKVALPHSWKESVKVKVPYEKKVTVEAYVTTVLPNIRFAAKVSVVGGQSVVCTSTNKKGPHGGPEYIDQQIPLSVLWTPEDYLAASGPFQASEGVKMETYVMDCPQE